MKIKILYCLLFVAFVSCQKSHLKKDSEIIPIPVSVDVKSSNFLWNASTSIQTASNQPELNTPANYLKDILTNSYPHDIVLGVGEKDNSIYLSIDSMLPHAEGYEIIVNEKNIFIKGKDEAGVFYGIQTLLQMMPPEVYKEKGLPESFQIAGVEISDYPRFDYRGMHLDVSRHFVSKENVKKYIDIIAMYKFNRFHWHLTDGVGWRIEIKKYPLLTQKTAFRPQATWKEFTANGAKFVDEGTPGAYGGYYTQDDIREIVAYAKARNITVIPEIEMPGHSEEVFVAYPELSCSGLPYKNGDFCAGNEKTFEFIEGVLDEVLELFPSEYIHIGGDEASKEAWKTCPKCQKRMKDENLKDLNELQSYFIKRVSDYLTQKDRKLIGWDEIIEGGLPPSATVMLWRDPKMAIKAASEGHHIIMTPGSHCYLDSYQANPATEPEAISGYLPLRKVYSFEVVPIDSIADFFIGGQGNIWAEYIPTYEHLEYMVFPRAIALSETLWSDKKDRNWEDFKRRLNNQLIRLEYLNVNFRKPAYELEMFQDVDMDKKNIKVWFESEQINPIIRYTLNGSVPDSTSMIYQDTINITTGVDLKAAIFVNNKPQDIYSKSLGYHKALGKTVTYNNKWTSYPAGGDMALTDGYVGSLTYGDGRWQGFTSDLDVVINFEEETEVSTFDANFMQLIGPGVYIPEYVEVLGSLDGANYTSLLKIMNDIPKEHDRLIFKNFSGSLNKAKVKYLKVKAKNPKGFIFVDELVVN